MGFVRLGLMCLILAWMLLIQLTVTDANAAEAPAEVVASATPFYGAKIGKEESVAEAPEIRRLGKHHFHTSNMASGGVLIGGLATAVFAVVFCYIRVTRKPNDVN